MPPVTVLVTFYSRCGTTETLASAAAVGAVQARANIRLRRVPDSSAEGTLAASPQCRETLTRMHKEYVAPTEADVIAVDAVVLVPPADSNTSSAEWADYLRVLTKLGSEGKLAGKIGGVVHTGSEPTVESFTAALSRFGLTLPDGATGSGDATERARELGRSVAKMAQRRSTEP